MSKPMYEIIEMIKAHYANDDDKFNSYAKAIINYFEKDGNIAGADEIIEIITTGHSIPRTSEPKLVTFRNNNNINICNNTNSNENYIIKPLIDNKNVNVNVNANVKENIAETSIEPESIEIKNTKENVKENIIENTNTASSNFLDNNLGSENTKNTIIKKESNNELNTNTIIKPKRHRRTKAEMAAARAELENKGNIIDNTSNINNSNNANNANDTNVNESIQPIIKPKRHRRTKAEMAAARLLENNRELSKNNTEILYNNAEYE